MVVILVFSLEHETLMLLGLRQGASGPAELFAALWPRRDLIAITVLLFLLIGVGIAAVITFVHYGSTRRTLEEVKGLARNILQSIPTGVLTVNQTGLITAVNPAAEAILQRPAIEVLGQSYESVFAEDDPMRLELDRARRREHVDHHDIAYTNGGHARMVRVTTADLTEEHGRPAGTLLLIKDVTELLSLERQVRVTEKLAGLQALSAGVAHELRNPLSAVDLNLHLLEEELREHAPLSARAIQYLQVLNGESKRLSAILDNFMRFARPASINLHAVDIKGLIAHIASLLQYEAEQRNVRFEILIAERLPALLGDETQISQVLVNIMVNAFQAMPDGGVCRITVAGQQVEGKESLEITVHDTGIGIKREALSRLFEPFYTTKPSGSGLGLAIAYRIVEDHGGTIEIESVPGSGTTVVVRLPAPGDRQTIAATT
ncbi:ATP-binding protein [Candidatus Nitrospira bockiana]